MKRLPASIAAAAVLVGALAAGPAPAAGGPGDIGAYLVHDVHGKRERSQVASTGADIVDALADPMVVRALRGERDAIAALGYDIEPAQAALDFPPADAGYHNYAEMVADINAVAAAHPATVHVFSIGSSYQSRDLVGVRISDDATDNLDEPGVLYVGLHHAREHLTVEVMLGLLHLFAESTDPAIQDLVATRQIYLVPNLNPDGGEYDVATGSYRFWRKNRQPNSGSSFVGTDLNRNYGYRWGCCGGSSGSPGSETYRGPAPFSAPETARLRDFVLDHSNIGTALSYHSYGELILYPYGYTFDDIPSDMTRLDHETFVRLGAEMASTTGYTSQQASDLNITDGDFNDWMYGQTHAFPITIELDDGAGFGFYPPDEFIPSEVQRNLDAAVFLAGVADCPPRVVPGIVCGVRNGGFESGLDQWTTTGGSIVGSPVHSGTSAARLAGSNSVTHTLTQRLAVPSTGDLDLWAQVTGTDTGSGDVLRVQVVRAGTTTTVATLNASAPHGAWQNLSADLADVGGRVVTLRFRATTNASAPSTFYVDDVSLR